MALVKTSLKLFGGGTVVVRCSERCHIHLMSEKNHVKDTQSDILSVQDRDNTWLTIPYTGVWDVLIDSRGQSLEYSISYVAAQALIARKAPGLRAFSSWLDSGKPWTHNTSRQILSQQSFNRDHQIAKTIILHPQLDQLLSQ